MISTTGYLLDTNVVAETRKVRAEPAVLAFLKAAEESALFLSVLTLGELRKGVEARRRIDSTVAVDQLGMWVDGIETTYAERVLPVDTSVARIWGELSATRSLPVIDTLIAATAIVHGLSLVTRNTRDAAFTGVPLINPWRAQ